MHGSILHIARRMIVDRMTVVNKYDKKAIINRRES